MLDKHKRIHELEQLDSLAKEEAQRLQDLLGEAREAIDLLEKAKDDLSLRLDEAMQQLA